MTLNVIFWSKVVTGSHWIKGLIFSYIVKFIGSLCYIGSLTLLNFTYASTLPFIALVLSRKNRGHWTFLLYRYLESFEMYLFQVSKHLFYGEKCHFRFIYMRVIIYLKDLFLTEKLCTIDIRTIIWEGQKMSIIQSEKKGFNLKLLYFKWCVTYIKYIF